MAGSRFEERGIVDDRDKKKVTRESLRQLLQIFSFITPYKVWFFSGLFFLILSSATTMVFPFVTGQLLDAASGKSGSFFENINWIASSLIGILFLQAVFSYFRIWLFARVSENAMSDIRLKVYAHIISLPLTFFEKRRVGELTSRITSDVSQLQDVLSVTLAEFLRQVSVLIIGLNIILITSTKLTLFMLATFPILVFLAIFFGRSIRKLSRKTQDELAGANVIVEETFQNIHAVKAFTGELQESLRYHRSLQNVVYQALSSARSRGAFVSFVIFALFGGIVLVLWYGAGLVANGEITIGQLTSFVLYTTFIGASVGGMGDMYGQLQKTVGASERLMEILGEQQEEASVEHSEIKRYAGEVVFSDVAFHYPSRKDVEVLKGIDFSVRKGEKVALIGQSGAGKSTIVQLLLRFYETDRGVISIDGRSIRDLSVFELRQNIGIVPQEVMLFGGTIRENIAYGKPSASEEEIVEAAKKAFALDFILSFPEGMDTLVGERGVKLSGGQKQRVAIARAILKNPSILILDEATSSLDSDSEYQVQQALEVLMHDRTTLIIAHRLSTIREADRIYVLDKGRITESGTHETLAGQEEGIYSKLLKLQMDTPKV